VGSIFGDCDPLAMVLGKANLVWGGNIRNEQLRAIKSVGIVWEKCRGGGGGNSGKGG